MRYQRSAALLSHTERGDVRLWARSFCQLIHPIIIWSPPALNITSPKKKKSHVELSNSLFLFLSIRGLAHFAGAVGLFSKSMQLCPGPFFSLPPSTIRSSGTEKANEYRHLKWNNAYKMPSLVPPRTAHWGRWMRTWGWTLRLHNIKHEAFWTAQVREQNKML